MNIYILIIMIVAGLPGGGVHTHSIEFTSQDTCIQARNMLINNRIDEKDNYSNRQSKITAVCVEK